MTTNLNEFAEPVPDQKVAAEAGMAANQTVAETPQPASGTPVAAVALTEPVSTRPPTSWSLESKAKWPTIPEHVRADILAWEADASAQFREYAGLKPLLREAERRGVEPTELLTEWKFLEDALRYDANAAIQMILRRMAVERKIPAEQFRQWAASLCADVSRAAEHARAMH